MLSFENKAYLQNTDCQGYMTIVKPGNTIIEMRKAIGIPIIFALAVSSRTTFPSGEHIYYVQQPLVILIWTKSASTIVRCLLDRVMASVQWTTLWRDEKKRK